LNKILKFFLIIVSIIVIGIGLTTYYLPHLLARFAEYQLSLLGFRVIAVDINRPGLSEILLPQVVLTKQTEEFDIKLDLAGIEVKYPWETLSQKKISSVNIDKGDFIFQIRREIPPMITEKEEFKLILPEQFPLNSLTIADATITVLGPIQKDNENARSIIDKKISQEAFSLSLLYQKTPAPTQITISASGEILNKENTLYGTIIIQKANWNARFFKWRRVYY